MKLGYMMIHILPKIVRTLGIYFTCTSDLYLFLFFERIYLQYRNNSLCIFMYLTHIEFQYQTVFHRIAKQQIM